MTMLRLARDGDVGLRLRGMRDGMAAVRVAATGAGLRSGLLRMLQNGPAGTADLCGRAGWSDEQLADALLQVLARTGLVRTAHGQWLLTRRGWALMRDDVARASYEGFSDYHTGLYGDIERQLLGGPARRDVVEKGETIARLSKAMDPFVLDVLREEVARRAPQRVLDVGCGSGSHLVHMLRVSPTATGVGVDADPAAARLARRTVAEAGLAGRAEIVEGDIRSALDAGGGPVDLALLANVIYYLPVQERVPLLRAVAERVEPGGAVVIVTTALTDAFFSRHFDLLLRAQDGAMELPDVEVLAGQLQEAGLVPGRPRRIAPGEPLTAIVATRG
ncbi:MAG TPA: class I SAM-dependent methyltransferase [Nocardioidaceae bacterium]